MRLSGTNRKYHTVNPNWLREWSHLMDPFWMCSDLSFRVQTFPTGCIIHLPLLWFQHHAKTQLPGHISPHGTAVTVDHSHCSYTQIVDYDEVFSCYAAVWAQEETSCTMFRLTQLHRLWMAEDLETKFWFNRQLCWQEKNNAMWLFLTSAQIQQIQR